MRNLHFKKRWPFVWGFGTLANLFGGYVSMDSYMKGNDIADLKEDAKVLNSDMRKAMFSKECYIVWQ